MCLNKHFVPLQLWRTSEESNPPEWRRLIGEQKKLKGINRRTWYL